MLLSWYSHPAIKFVRVGETIQPVCTSSTPVPKDTVLFYEIPAKSKSTGGDFRLDVIRYTMQCIYAGESLFPSAFNQEINRGDDESIGWRVFFDYAFHTSYKRRVADKLALALLSQSTEPYLFKAMGIFQVDPDGYNCHRVSFVNGESFLVASRQICDSEIIKLSGGNCVVPGLQEDEDGFKCMAAMNDVALEDIQMFRAALGCRGRAAHVRPDGRVRGVNGALDPGLEGRIRKYAREKRLGLTDIHEGVHRLSANEQEQDCVSKMEEMFELLVEKAGSERPGLVVDGSDEIDFAL
ncbi:unnamed protein product [Pylaiella littoralis]